MEVVGGVSSLSASSPAPARRAAAAVARRGERRGASC